MADEHRLYKTSCYMAASRFGVVVLLNLKPVLAVLLLKKHNLETVVFKFLMDLLLTSV